MSAKENGRLCLASDRQENQAGDQTNLSSDCIAHDANAQSTDHITILSHSHSRLAKLWAADGTIKPYDDSKHYSVRTEHVTGIGELSALLTALEREPRSGVIRGKYKGEAAAAAIDADHKPGLARKILALYDDVPLHWLLVEVDKFTPTVDPVAEPVAAITEFVNAHLPPQFRDITYHWQLSSSAGHARAAGQLKVHLWYWLAEPARSEDLKRWAETQRLPIDRSVLNTVQLHYTAAPLAEPGVVIPVPVRSGLVRGMFDDEVTLDIERAPAPSADVLVWDGDADDLLGLTSKLGWSLEQAREILFAVNADGNRETWLQDLAAFHHETGGTTEALEIAVEWSAQAENFSSRKDVEERWSSFGKYRGRPTTGRWLLQRRNERRAQSPDTAASLIDELRSMSHEVLLSTWAARAASLPKDQAAAVVEEVHRLTGVGKRALNGALTDARRGEKEHRLQRAAGSREVIIVKPEDTFKQAAGVGTLILQRGAPTDLVMFADRPAHIVESDMPFAHAHDDDEVKAPLQVQIVSHTTASMRALVEHHAVFQRHGERGPVAIQVPAAIVENLQQLNPANAPLVAGLIAHPIVTARGEIISTNGLHRGTGLFAHGLTGQEVRPFTQGEASAALAWLSDNYLAGFEFAGPIDRTIAMAGLITGIQRRVLDCAPGLAILAPSQSSGKTTLARRMHVLLTGRDLPVVSLPVGDEAEIEKRLLALLLGSPPMVCFDNVADGLTVHGGALNAAITSPVLEGRLLGSTQIVRVPTNTMFVLTGNNLKLGADETTRFLSTTLAPRSARPETRIFRHPDVVAHAGSIRAEVHRCVVGIVAGYSARGGSIDIQSGSRFVAWDRMVRQPLLWAGGGDAAQAFTNNSEEAEHLQALRALLRELTECFGDRSFSARDVVNACGTQWASTSYALQDALEGLQARDVKSPKSVGRVLAAVSGRAIDVGGAHVRVEKRIDRDGVGRFAIARRGV